MADVMVDSNIWIYYFNQTTPEHHKVTTFMETLLETREIAINVIILMECSHYLIKSLGPVIGKEKINLLISSGITINDLSLKESMLSIDYLQKYSHTGIGGRDATILSSMKSMEIKQLVTHDKAFQRIGEIDVVDPVTENK